LRRTTPADRRTYAIEREVINEPDATHSAAKQIRSEWNYLIKPNVKKDDLILFLFTDPRVFVAAIAYFDPNGFLRKSAVLVEGRVTPGQLILQQSDESGIQTAILGLPTDFRSLRIGSGFLQLF
jgi:hypothetical protein